MKQSQAMSVLTSQTTQEWYTPSWIIELARKFLGSIDLDPASNAKANETVKATWYFDSVASLNGLTMPYKGNVWLNPPFNNTAKWVDKLDQEYDAKNVHEALLLVNSAHGYKWYEAAWRKRHSCLLRERVHFVQPDGTTIGAAKKGQTILYYGDRLNDFATVFSPYGRVFSKVK